MSQEETLTFAVPWIPKTRIEARALDLIRKFDEAEAAGLLVEAKGIDPMAYLEFLVGEELLTTHYTADLGPDILGEFRFQDPRLSSGGNSIVLSRELTADHPHRSFTAAHEIGHLSTHYPLYVESQKQIPLLTADVGSTIRCYRQDLVLRMREPAEQQRARVEWQANFYAACLLLPAPSVLRQCQEFMRVSLNRGRDALLRHLARTFHCSKQCAEIRLRELAIQGLP
jgi:hypothetical protein